MTHTHTTNLTERVFPMRFCLPAYPFLRSLLLQITTATTKTDTARPDTTTEGTVAVVIETGTGTVTTDATGTEDMTGIVTNGTTTGGLEDTTEDGDIDGNARIGHAEGATTTCKLMARQRVTAVTAIEDGARSVERMVWVLRNEGAPPRQMRPRWL